MFRKRHKGRRVFKAIFWFLLIIGPLAAGGYYITHYNDDGRIIYKRFKAKDKYVFDEIHPRFLQTNPADLIATRSARQVKLARDGIIDAIWGTGGFPLRLQPQKVETVDSAQGLFILGVKKIERLVIPHDYDLKSISYVLHPTNWNGRAIIYQHGYAGTFHQMQRHIQRLIDAGFVVAVSNYYGYGENKLKTFSHPKFGQAYSGMDNIMLLLENPLRLYVNPVIVTMNYLQSSLSIDTAAVMGFSAGGWVATLAAASDVRFKDSFAVASLYPLYLRENLYDLSEAPKPQMYAPLLWAANYLEMFVSAASGKGRSYTQIFNQYDRCCYRNRKGKLYEEAVQGAVSNVGPGQFEVLIDVSHADHRVSDWAMNEILSRLN